MTAETYRLSVLAQLARLIPQPAGSVEQCEVGVDVAAALEHPVVARQNDVVVVCTVSLRTLGHLRGSHLL